MWYSSQLPENVLENAAQKMATKGITYSRVGLAGLLVREAVKTALQREESAEGRSLEAFLSSEDDCLPFYFQNNSRGHEGQSIS